jgi:multisubunit Na+/H+ antiporter MnhF subunit
MAISYCKRHVQASVIAATIYGIAFGFWLGARSQSASFIEAAIVTPLMLFLPAVIFSKIDKKYETEN